MLVGLFKRVPSFASWSAILLLIMRVCALIFCIVILCVNQSLDWIMTAMSSLLEANRTRDEIAQAYTPIQRHINIIWSEMISYSHCFFFYCLFSSLWFIQTIHDYFVSPYGLVLWPYSNLIIFHTSFITFILTMRQSNALPSTLPLCE